MQEELPTTLGEISRVALAAFENVPDSVTHVSVATSHGTDVTCSRYGARLWASLEPTR
jgi:hypothetical protein